MAVPSPSPPTKSALRAEGLRRRRDFARALAPALRAELERELARHRPPASDRRQIVAAYHPLRDEISPVSDPRRARRRPARRLALVRSIATRGCSGAEAPAREPSPWGVLQPAGRGRGAGPGRRAGPARRSPTGAAPGSATARAITTAPSPICARAARSSPSASAGRPDRRGPIPPDPWDVPLDAIATPKEWIRCRCQSRAGASPPGILLILLLIAGWAVLVATPRRCSPALPRWRHIFYYLVGRDRLDPAAEAAARWMETGAGGRGKSANGASDGARTRDLRRDRPAL